MTELPYKNVNGFLLLDVEPIEEPELIQGKYSYLRLSFLKNWKKGQYISLLTQMELVEHLNSVQVKASEMEDRLMAEMAEREDVTEELKANDPMAWVGAMNNIRNRAEEIVFAELIYV